MSTDDTDLLDALIDRIESSDQLGMKFIDAPGGGVALIPRVTTDAGRWEAMSAAMHQRQREDMLRVKDDTEESSEPEGEAFDAIPVRRI